MAESNIPSDVLNVSLPNSITVTSIAAARIKEIEAMQKNIEEKSGTKMVFQKLPKHMRRRAMSHAVKRLPRRLREIHLNQMTKSGLAPKAKKPNRKHRRRLRNLQSDYARRQRRVKWLNTHIWHAKRFHMIEKWGFKLPKQPCDKSFRACYRATTQHCLIQDISYERCIQIDGAYEDIIQGLKNTTVGLSFGAKCFAGGKKFGELILFDCNKAVGDVQFFWNSTNNVLWLFVHPAFYKQVLDLLIGLFEMNLVENQTSYRGPKNVELKELEYELDRFRLTGPLSTAVLKNALRTVKFTDKHPDYHAWLQNYPLEILSEQNQVFQNLTNTSYLPPNLLISILVHDPRLNLPNKRTKASLTQDEKDDFDKLQQNSSLSPLWNESVRQVLKDTKLSNAAISEKRSQFLIPGTELSMDLETILPVILMWRPGKKGQLNNGYGSGWDVIVASNWSQSFFMSFVMWGARAGGLRETKSVAFEKSQTDLLYPDTKAGELEEHVVMEECVEKFFRIILLVKQFCQLFQKIV
ncbi:unnamed protein product [Ceutorhynchus assimilis]|uniref:Uncharacterized protein n=1 Tax=Ceutorhynchus assimilis TaxID=467358 RepID=A0A9P0GPJ7_9CUCU|nr:unnamed protein product [Ceutorhynchus assimilis]